MLYYHKESYELKELPPFLIEEWKLNNNPKSNDWILAPNKPGENYLWNKGVWEPIVPSVPTSISARQIRIWLVQNGINLSQIESAINNIDNITLRDITKIEWEYAPYIERSHPMLVPLAQSLGLSESDIDRAFMEAANI
jgi:hypothetical protein